jgi:drug/metabolite transporter (DMT)-like permease
LILYAFAQVVGDFLLIKGTRMVEASIGSLILPFEAIFGIVLAFVFFHETLPITTFLGGGLIILASIIPNIPRKQIISQS